MLVITGGAGFLGSAILWRLNAAGRDDIVIVDNLGKGPKWRNLLKRRYVDYMDRDRFMDMVRSGALPWKTEAIIHMGACSSTTENDAGFLMENNFHYSRNLCLYALDRGIRFINASSAATYGRGEHGFFDDPALIPALRPLNMYGYSKHLFDLWLLREKLAENVASLKFFNVYGPNEYHKGDMASVAWKTWKRIKMTGRAALFASHNPSIANGEQKRDFVYVKDCANLVFWLLENPGVNGIHNVGTGKAQSFNELARAVFAAMDMKPEIEYIPMPEAIAPNYQNFTEADMAWLKNLDYPEKFSTVGDGVADYVEKYLEKDDHYL